MSNFRLWHEIEVEWKILPRYGRPIISLLNVEQSIVLALIVMAELKLLGILLFIVSYD